MNQNNKKNSRPDGGKNSNWRGLLSLISWALLLTIIVSYATNYMNSAGRRASSVVCRRSVRLLNSAAIWPISSVPLI